jgi:hypothetical protein
MRGLELSGQEKKGKKTKKFCRMGKKNFLILGKSVPKEPKNILPTGGIELKNAYGIRFYVICQGLVFSDVRRRKNL